MSSPKPFAGHIAENDSDAAVLPTAFELLPLRTMNQANKRRWIAFGILALATASVAFLVFGLSKPEPLYEGRPVNFWIEQMGWRSVQGSPVPLNVRAWEAFARTNQEALPFLIATLKASPPLRDVLVARLRPVLPRKIAARLPLRDYPVDFAKAYALSAISRMGPDAREAVPALINTLTDNQTRIRHATAYVLGRVGPDAMNALPALIRSLKDTDSQVRLSALDALNQIAPDDERFLSTLGTSLTDNHKDVRFRAAELLLGKNRNSPALFVTLTGLLREPEAADRWHAIELLRKGGPEAAVVVPALIERLKDENNRVRGLAAIALGEIGPSAQVAVPALREALKDEYVNVREAAAETLKKTDPDERH